VAVHLVINFYFVFVPVHHQLNTLMAISRSVAVAATRKQPNLSDDKRRAIYEYLLEHSRNSKLHKGARDQQCSSRRRLEQSAGYGPKGKLH
jgi:hypothetical protein